MTGTGNPPGHRLRSLVSLVGDEAEDAGQGADEPHRAGPALRAWRPDLEALEQAADDLYGLRASVLVVQQVD